MLAVVDQHRIRKAYYVEKKSIREIAREVGYSRNAMQQALPPPPPNGSANDCVRR